MGDEWANAYAEMARQNNAKRLAMLKVHGGKRKTVTRTTVEVYESVRGVPNTQRKVSSRILSIDTEREFFEVEDETTD